MLPSESRGGVIWRMQDSIEAVGICEKGTGKEKKGAFFYCYNFSIA